MSTQGKVGSESTTGNDPISGSQSTEEGKETPEEVIEEELTAVNKGIETEVFGKWSAVLRNLLGALGVFTVCLGALANAWTTNVSVTQKGEWPSEVSMIVMNIGPIVIAWAFINTNKILATILGGEGITTKMRTRLADIIAPDKKQ